MSLKEYRELRDKQNKEKEDTSMFQGMNDFMEKYIKEKEEKEVDIQQQQQENFFDDNSEFQKLGSLNAFLNKDEIR